MFPNLNKKFQQIINNMDPKALEKGLKTFSELMKTEEGRKIAEQLKHIDKEQLMEKMKSMNENDLVEKLDNLDPDELSKKISDVDKEKLLKTLTSNPDLLEKLREYMDKNQ